MIKFSEKVGFFFFPEDCSLQLSRFGNATFHTSLQPAAWREMLNGIWVAVAVGARGLSGPSQRGSKSQRCILKDLMVLLLESRNNCGFPEYVAHSST